MVQWGQEGGKVQTFSQRDGQADRCETVDTDLQVQQRGTKRSRARAGSTERPQVCTSLVPDEPV